MVPLPWWSTPSHYSDIYYDYLPAAAMPEEEIIFFNNFYFFSSFLFF